MLCGRRKRFEWVSEKVGKLFSVLPLTPNQWTLLSLLPAAAAFYFLSLQEFLPAALSIIIAGALDFIDGAVARFKGRATRFGAYLDTITDRYAEGLIVMGLLFAGLPSFVVPAQIWLFAYFFGAMMTTYAKAAAREKELVKTELTGGLLERAERLLLLLFGILLAVLNPFYLTCVLSVLAVLSNITALQRILAAKNSAHYGKGN